jgi:Zn-dependent protease with chaperone function
MSTLAKRIWDKVVGGLILLLIIVIWAAQLRSCVRPDTAEKNQKIDFKIAAADATNPREAKIAAALERIWDVTPSASTAVKLYIAKSSEMNAASFGDGRFLFWDGDADLPTGTLEAVAAHEVAHDVLLHAKKASELQDLTDFFGSIVGLFTGSDDSTENVLKQWLGSAVLPKYSRAQELEADAKAVELLRSAGVENPKKAMADCLQTLLDKYGNSGGKFFDDHPSTQERIAHLNAQ